MIFNLKRFYIKIFIFLFNFFLNFGNNLIGNVINMWTTSTCTNTIDKADLFELSIWSWKNNLPSIIINLIITNFRSLGIRIEVQIDIFHKGINCHIFSIDVNFDFRHNSSHIIGSFGKQTKNIIIKSIHFEPFKIWIESNLSKILLSILLNFCIAMLIHIISPDHSKLLPGLLVATLDYKLLREYIGQFGSISISASYNPFLAIVVVTACQ